MRPLQQSFPGAKVEVTFVGPHPDLNKLAQLLVVALAPVAVIGFVVVHIGRPVWWLVPPILWAVWAGIWGEHILWTLGWFEVRRVAPAPQPDLESAPTVTVLGVR